MMETITPHLPQLILAWSVQLVGVISPGPSVVLIMGIAVQHGRATALATTLGVACASVIFAIVTVIGLAALFAQMADLVTIMRFLGAAYLAYLAVKAWRTAVTLPPIDLTAAPKRRAGVVLSGFLLQVTNPKAIMFWLAIASIGGVGSAPLPVIILFVVGAFVNSFVGHGLYAILLSARTIRDVYLNARRGIETVLGSVFAFASFRLATGGN